MRRKLYSVNAQKNDEAFITDVMTFQWRWWWCWWRDTGEYHKHQVTTANTFGSAIYITFLYYSLEFSPKRSELTECQRPMFQH